MSKDDLDRGLQKEANRLVGLLVDIINNWNYGAYEAYKGSLMQISSGALFINILLLVIDNKEAFLKVVNEHYNNLIREGTKFYEEKEERE